MGGRRLLSLDQMQVEKVEGYFGKFQEYLKTEDAKVFDKQLTAKLEFFGRLLGKDHIEKLTEVDFRQILEGLFANEWWTNKDFPTNRVLKSNEFETLKMELKNLLWGAQQLEHRYERSREKINGLGPSSRTEILAFVHPKECGMWNSPARRALHILGFDKTLPTTKYSISGTEYSRFNQVLQSIRELMAKSDLPSEDLIDVDLFLYFVEGGATGIGAELEEHEDFEFDHDEVIEMLVKIGGGLGFESESEYLVSRGAKVDAKWTARIGNLGTVTYAFEVQKHGSIDSLILNLQRAKNNPTVQKLVVVANSSELAKIREEVTNLPEEFRKSLAFIEAKEVVKASSLLQEFNIILSRLELVQPQV